MKIGDVITKNGYRLLVLDFIDSKPFVLILNFGHKMPFDAEGNNYKISNIHQCIEEWSNQTTFSMIKRKVDLTSLFHEKEYGTIEANAALLTFNEWYKYKDIIQPYLWEIGDFWLATPVKCNNSTYAISACFVRTDSKPDYNGYYYTNYCAPAFILDEDTLKTDLSNSTTEELLEELRKRIK